MATHNLEDLLDEIDEDAVIEILEDSNAMGMLLKAAAANYLNGGLSCDEEVQSALRVVLDKALEIREYLVRQKYPISDNNPNQ